MDENERVWKDRRKKEEYAAGRANGLDKGQIDWNWNEHTAYWKI